MNLLVAIIFAGKKHVLFQSLIHSAIIIQFSSFSIAVLPCAFQAPVQIGSSTGNTLCKVFVKYQGINIFKATPSNQFNYVPDLNEAFHVSKNTLFRITFQGTLHNPQPGHSFVQIMVNDYLIIGNRLFPNTDQRWTMIPGSNDFLPDGYGGHSYGGIAQHSTQTRIAMVYLAPGTYTFNVGVRPRNSYTDVTMGFVTYELTQFDNSNQDLGDFQLTTIPQ